MPEQTGLPGLRLGLRAAAPIVAGYLPTAAAFGLAARQVGLSPAEATLMSLLVYAGASQFAMAGMLGAGAAAPAILVTALTLNLRHVLYGPSLAPRVRACRRVRAAVAAFGLTDEVFAVLSAGRGLQDACPAGLHFRGLVALEAGAYLSWVGGTLAGAVSGDAMLHLLPALAPALGFALTALFVALLVPGLSDAPAPTVAAVAAAALVALVLRLLGHGSWSVLAAGVAGPAVGVAVAVRREGRARRAGHAEV